MSFFKEFYLVEFVGLELSFSGFGVQEIHDFFASVVEVGVDRSEVAEDFLLARLHPQFCVAVNRVELVVNHASVGLFAGLALGVRLQHKRIVIGQ